MAAGGVLVGRGYVSIRPEFEGDWSRQASSHGSRAGSSAGGGFTKAFGAALRGLGPALGASMASALGPAIAASAALAPALATAGAAAATLKLGLAGVGDALTAAFADGSADAKAAASATRAVESAQRGLAGAQRALADARVQAAERVREAQKAVADAERGVARAVEESAQRQRDAQQQVRDAERDLRDAQREAREAQASLTDARREATRALEDMNSRLAESRLDEREATLRVAEAERELKAAQAKPGTTPEQLAKLQLAYDRAKLNLEEQRRETKRLADDTAKANKAGIDGSQQVQRVRERIASTTQRVTDRERALADAQDNVRKAGVEGARAVADAQRALAEAQAGVDKARADGQRQIEDAQRGVAEAAAALADAQAAAAAQTSKLDEAMAKLSPNARQFVNSIRSIAPAWGQLRTAVQDRLFEGLGGRVEALSGQILPTLKTRLTETAGVFNAMGKSAMDAVSEMQRTGMLDKILAGAAANLRVFEDAPGRMVTAFGQLTVAAQPAFNNLLTRFDAAMTRMSDRLSAAFASGRLEQAINTAFGLLAQVGRIMADAFGTVGNILRGAAEGGGQVLDVVRELFAELRRVTGLPEVQAALGAVFLAVSQIAQGIAPMIGAAIHALAPLLQALGEGLQGILRSLNLAAVTDSLTDSLGPLVSAVSSVVSVGAAVASAFGPAVQGAFRAIADVAALLAPLLTFAAQVLGAVLVPVVRLAAAALAPLTVAISAVATWVRTYWEWLLPLGVAIAGVTLAMTAQRIAVALTTGVFAVYRTVILAGTAVTQGFAAAQALLSAVMRANPIGLVITALVALATAVVVAYRKSDTFRSIVQAAWRGIQTAASWAWEHVLRPLLSALGAALEKVGGFLSWLWEDVFSPIFGWIGDKASSLWNKVLKPTFDAIGKGIKAVGDSFEDAKDFIGKAWGKVQEIARKPVRFLIETLYNKAIVPTWNKVATAFGADPIKEMVLPKGFARGGVLPGYTPGRDVHRYYSPTGGALELSGGEAIMRPEFTRAVGARFVHVMNAVARSRGASGVKAALAPALGGDPATPVDHTLRYADGGIFGWIGKKIGGAGTAVWNGVKKGASWLADTLERSARAGMKHVVDPLLAKFPGADTNFGRMLRRIPTKILDSIFGYSKTADTKGAGGLGGPRIKAALAWARTQHGKRYQWGGNGNPSWDCSGFMSAIESVIRGQKPHRRWSTHAFNGGTPPGWVRNGNSPFRVGITHAGVGHTAGTLGGVNVESRGGDGVVVGKRARGYNDKLFTSWYGFQPGKYDSGGYLQPGLNLAYNGTGRPEPVFTTQQANALMSRAAGPSGLQPGDSLRLVVGDREFDAYVDGRADGRVAAVVEPAITAMRATRRG